jgi:predicted DNA-binding transcriptional regulator YafY
VLEPYGLVLKAGVWYLCARVAAPHAGAFRVYRLDRFTSVGAPGTVGAEGGTAHGAPGASVADADRFVRDEGFDLPGFWAEHAEQFARSLLRTEVVVRLSPEGARRLPGVVDPESARRALADPADADREGRITVTLPVESEEVAHAQLTALGPEAEVLAPASLRRRLAADARRLAALYA